MSEVSLYPQQGACQGRRGHILRDIYPTQSSGVEQWLQRHPEAGSFWPGWPKASYHVKSTSREHRQRAPAPHGNAAIWPSVRPVVDKKGETEQSAAAKIMVRTAAKVQVDMSERCRRLLDRIEIGTSGGWRVPSFNHHSDTCQGGERKNANQQLRL